MKMPRTGSSWFHNSLDGIPGFHIKPQLLACHKKSGKPAKEARTEMMKPLLTPCKEGHTVSGYTQNPEHQCLRGLKSNFTFLRQVEDVRFVSWTRTNFVHRAFSLLNRKKCHTFNTATLAKAEECRSVKYTMDKMDFLAAMEKSACSNHDVRAVVSSLGQGRALHLVYEDFVRDNDKVLTRLLNFLEVPVDVIQARKHAGNLKISNTNVSLMLENAAEVGAWLSSWEAPGVPLTAMYRDTSFATFSLAEPETNRMCQHMRGLLRSQR
eukprot:CAMPEP_0179146490 /NCGR_PEP_ID=MMETSP0796-20121207/70738_1 /TAXON_ID=73915 /ORGANISM="Pyrodinium bahamense, Strain pbaha01" /LENGTH=266 /DNA_ID=CAMNT_0020846965 /DNA_START=84 /DNA_END=884 /DNA_ORIENTATION=+